MTVPSGSGRLSLRHSLVARLVISFLLLSVLMVAAVAAVAYVRARSMLETSVYERLEAVADDRATGLDRWIDEQQRNVVFAGRIPGVGDDARDALDTAANAITRQTARDAVASVLDTVIQQTADAQEFMILDDAGIVRISTRPEHEGASLADEPLFQRGTSNTTVQNVYTSSLTGEPTISVGTPLFDAGGRGRRVAVLASNLSLARIDRIVLARSGLGTTGTAYLVGPDRRFIHRSLAVGEAAAGVSSTAIDAALQGGRGRGLYLDYRGAPVIGVHRWLEDREAALVVEMSQAEAFAPANELALTIALVGLIATGILAIAIYLVSRQVARPILSLAAVAARVRDGDLTASATVETEDEVGVLATAFNDMTARLRESVETLERRVDERTAELTSALEAQHEAEQRYRRLVEELPLAVYMDPPGSPLSGSLYVSPPIEAMFGYPAEEWLEDGFFGSVVHPGDRDRVVTSYTPEEEDSFSGEYRIITKDGRTVWVRDDASLVRDEHGEPAYVLGFFVDVTAQNEAAAEVRRQKAYFESLVAISPAAVVTMDRDERVTGWNPAAERLFGYTPEEAIGRSIDELVMDTEAMREEGAGVAREAVETGRASRLSRRTRKGGGSVDVEITMVPLVVDGSHTGFYAVYHDITELQAARRDAEAATQAKSVFLASMSHEIRTPMNAVIGMSGLLLDTEQTPEQEEYARIIRTSGESLLAIINDILDFSKIEAGRMELETAPFDLIECLESALDLTAGRAAEKGLELVNDLQPDLPRMIVGDETRLRQIVLNLLSNAIKFTDRGEVVLSAGPTTDDVTDGSGVGGASAVRVAVRDTGLGIPADRMGRLFQSFSQADVSTSRRYGGTGLGLVISRRLAELMGGRVWAESNGIAGQGSTFLFHLPAPLPGGDLAAPSAPRIDLAGRRILVVEGNQTVRRRLVDRLRAWSATVDDVASAAEAAWPGDAPRLDAVVIAEVLPDGSGLEAAATLHDRLSPDPPAIVIASAFGRRETVARLAEARGLVVAGHLSKPIKTAGLAGVMSSALGVEAPRSASAPSAVRPDAGMAADNPLRILIAEDNPVNQKLALRLLEQRGYRADVAGNGLEVLESLERQPYDLVLMDVQMPEMDGLEATRRIVERWRPAERPRIVAMTANASTEDREACLTAGMDGYISKPIRPQELTDQLAGTRARA